jgi:hypothetical protein
MCKSGSSWFTIIFRIRILNTASSVADPECLSLLPDQTFFFSDPGSDFFPSRIPDPNFFHPGSRIHTKDFKYFNSKNCFFKLTENFWFILFTYCPDGLEFQKQITNTKRKKIFQKKKSPTKKKNNFMR